MGCLRFGYWSLILVQMLLLQIHPVKMQRVDPVSQKLRRLNEQFQQFQELTQARLDRLALNQNRSFSGEMGSHIQALSDHWHHMSQNLEQLKESTTQEIDGLREWSRKLEKKIKRMEGRLALMERNMRENRRHVQKQKPDPGPDFFNLTLELQSQEERLAALQVQRDELLIGLKGLQESLKNQALRVTQLEGRLSEHYGRSQTHRGGKPRRILQGHTQPRPDDNIYSRNDNHSQATAHSRNPLQPQQHQATPNHPKHHTQESRPQPEFHPQMHIPYANLKARSTDFQPQPDFYHPQSQIKVQAQTRPYPGQEEQLQSLHSVPYPHAQIQPEVKQQSQSQLYGQRHHQLHNTSHHQPIATHLKPTKDRQSRTHVEAPQPQASGALPWPESESYQPRVSGWPGGEEGESNTKVESSVIHNLLGLPVRHKIPARPVPKKDATICNVDSMLVFPSASAENYVTFSLTLPDLPELSVCLWLRVEASQVGTLLSYATDDNDNQLVLYGRHSSASSASSSSSLSLDFVIGDPAYRRLPASLLLDTRWHHFCFVWSSIQGRFWHYSDWHLTSSGSNFRKGWEIPGGGSVILGQEQDAVGGGFDPAEGFAGQMAGFRVWNRVLSPSEVEGVAQGRGVPRGVVLGMEDIKEVHGEVQQVACECLEHCV